MHRIGTLKGRLWSHVHAMQGGYGPLTSLRTLQGPDVRLTKILTFRWGRLDTNYYIQNSGRFKHTWLHRKPTGQPRAIRVPSHAPSWKSFHTTNVVSVQCTWLQAGEWCIASFIAQQHLNILTWMSIEVFLCHSIYFIQYTNLRFDKKYD